MNRINTFVLAAMLAALSCFGVGCGGAGCGHCCTQYAFLIPLISHFLDYFII